MFRQTIVCGSILFGGVNCQQSQNDLLTDYFYQGLAFRYRKNSVWWDKLLKGKTAHIITTLDQPGIYYRLMFGRPSVNQLRKSVLEFCGIKPVRVTYIGVIKTSDENQRKIWLDKVRSLTNKQK